MREGPTLVLFCGGMRGSGPEAMLAGALQENVVDLLDVALASGAFDGAIVVADAPASEALASRLPSGVRLDTDAPGAAFHFGSRLKNVVRENELQRPVYVSCGLPLLAPDELAAVANQLVSTQDPLVISNNYYSADLVAFFPGAAVADLDVPDNDRILPRLLTQRLKFRNQSLPRTASNQFDLDSPADLLTLAVAGAAGPNLSRYVASLGLETLGLKEATAFFTDDQAEILVAGRVGSRVWQYLESETACRVRFFSEERGMMAAGREARGEARSLLAFHLESVGPLRFFQEIGEMVQCAFIDTRPLMAHLGGGVPRADRFNSDLLRWEDIETPWLRDFTSAAAQADYPVILGGNSLVASALELLSEAAWRRKDEEGAPYKPKGRAAGP